MAFNRTVPTLIWAFAATLSRLGARVQEGTLSVWLGPGLLRQSYPLTDMAGVNVTHTDSD